LYFIWDASDRSQVFAGSTTSATQLSHHIPVSHQLASKLLAVASQSFTILPDWVRRSQVPAHQALRAHFDLSLGRLPGRDWKRRPGRPNNRWVDQVRNDTSNMSSTFWRSAILRGHGTGVTQCPSPAMRTWWWWWFLYFQWHRTEDSTWHKSASYKNFKTQSSATAFSDFRDNFVFPWAWFAK